MAASAAANMSESAAGLVELGAPEARAEAERPIEVAGLEVLRLEYLRKEGKQEEEKGEVKGENNWSKTSESKEENE